MNKLLHILLLIIITSCASTTIIKTGDPLAKIYADGKYIGIGSAVYTDRKISWLSTDISIQKSGCISQEENFSKSERLDILPLVTGFFLYVPFLYVMKYQAVHEYEFICSKTN